MLGLFGSLNMATRSLQTQRMGTEVAGHNLANVNTPNFARQRLAIQTSLTIPSAIGPTGTGAEAVGIVQLRNTLIDRQLTGEISVRGAYESRQRALQFGQASLGQLVDRQATGASGAAAASGTGGQHGLAEGLSGLFASFQSLSTQPTSSVERQALIIKAQSISSQFNQISTRLADLKTGLNETLAADVGAANVALGEIARLNAQIFAAEAGGTGQANDLRDIRQQRIEDLSKLVKIDVSATSNGAVDISVGGTTLVQGLNALDTLETYDAGGGQLLVRTATSGTPLTLTGGALKGTIDARDGELAALGTNLNTLAAHLIAEVNAVHAAGFGLDGTTGEDFFTGTDASDIALNANLASDPRRIQASGVAGAVGDNSVVLQLAQLAEKNVAGLGNQTFLQNYGQTVAALGQSLHDLNSEFANQQIVEKMLLQQRDSVMGVSLDEEMTDLIKFQRAFEASARLVSTIDEMLATVVNLGR